MEWMPLNEIKVHGEPYVYVGDTTNSKRMKDHNQKFAHDQGRKVAFIVDKNDSTKVCEYVSKKFYPKTCKTLYP
jgi:hypothetical protein